MNKALAMCVVMAVAPSSRAVDAEAGRATVSAVCAACHGAAGVSVSDTVPNLAAQRAVYLEVQLKALKDGTRKSPIMNAIAAQLSLPDIANVAAYFAAQPGAETGAKSSFLPNLAKTGVTFPEGYPETFKKYQTSNFPPARQVRLFYANPAALHAAHEGRALPDGSVLLIEVHAAKLDADGKPVTGADGYYVADRLVSYSVMARAANWGQDIPEMLRNEDWNYGVFASDKQLRSGVNLAECLACHKPQGRLSYTYTLKQLADVQ